MDSWKKREKLRGQVDEMGKTKMTARMRRNKLKRQLDRIGPL
jgi:hypothetical protein